MSKKYERDKRDKFTIACELLADWRALFEERGTSVRWKFTDAQRAAIYHLLKSVWLD